VLKLYRKGFTLSSVLKEEKISRIVYEAGLPVPVVYGIINIGNRHGVLLLDEIISKPHKLIYFTDLLAELHAKIHSVKTNQLQKIHEKLRSQILKAPLISEKERKIAIETLNKLPKDNAICHGDFHPGNIIMSKQGPVVIDWVDASQGDYHADITRTILLIQVAEHPELRKAVDDYAESKLGEYYIKRYSRIKEISRELLDEWKLPVVTARLSEGLNKKENARLMSLFHT